MPRYKIIYKSDENIISYLRKSDEWVQYPGRFTIRDGGKTPVTLDMTFEPPQPFALNMPETHSIKARLPASPLHMLKLLCFSNDTVLSLVDELMGAKFRRPRKIHLNHPERKSMSDPSNSVTCDENTQEFTIHLPCSLAKRIEKYANDTGDTVTGVVIEALDALLRGRRVD